MKPDDYDSVLLLRKLIELIDALFRYGGKAALGIAGGAVLLASLSILPVFGSWELEHSAAWGFHGRARSRYRLRAGVADSTGSFRAA